MSIEDCDVLVVGAGPVGLLLALMLHANGVKVKLVERQKALYPLPRAVAFDHESYRLFGSLGLSKVLDPILEKVMAKGGEEGSNYVWRDKDLKLVVDLYTEAPTRSGLPSVMSFSQPQLESLLEKAVLERKIPLIRGFNLTQLDQHADHVDAYFDETALKAGTTIEERDAPELVNGNGHRSTTDLHVRASYVIGCDGANSTVRRLQKFTVTDLNFENDWLIADLVLKDGYLPPLVKRVGAAQICDPARPTTCVFGGAGRKRFEFMRLESETKDELLREEKLWELLAPWGFTKGNVILERMVIYTFKARWANEFFKGRVGLAGDALHLMPPFIGQGLNSGFRDAGALAWRLPLILSGKANAGKLLNSYQVERLAHIRRLTEACIHLGEVVCETDALKSKMVHAALRKNAPPRFYDPPLGQPGTLTPQEESGRLMLQRKLRVSGGEHLFHDAHGYGWLLVSYGHSVECQLSDDSRKFWNTLGGRVVTIKPDEDEGEYREWFKSLVADAVLVRPDFYVFGYAPAAGVDTLVRDLRARICY